MASGTVLIVDGSWHVRRLIRTNLEAQGLEVIEATGGRECLERWQERRFDLILLSAQLPDANGWNIVHQLRQSGAGAPVPIIVIGTEPARSRLLRRFERVSQLLTPFSALTLVQSVGRALDQENLRALS